jgi:signal transduction histidine kinase
MGNLPIKLWLSLRTKVLVPVILVMTVVMAVSLTLVQRDLQKQLVVDADGAIVLVDTQFHALRAYRDETLKTTFRNFINEPRFKSVARLLADSNGDSNFQLPAKIPKGVAELQPQHFGWNTFKKEVDDMLGEGVADFIYVSGTSVDDINHEVFLAKDPRLTQADFTASLPDFSVLVNQGAVTVAELKGRFFDVVALPITMNGQPIGKICFGVTTTIKDDMTGIIPCQFVLLKNGRVCDSTAMSDADLATIQNETAASKKIHLPAPSGKSDTTRDIRPLTLEGKKYRVCFNRIEDPIAKTPLTYAIFNEGYNDAIANLALTRRLILFLGLAAIFGGSLVVWLVVRHTTAPLHELRDSAEAVGAGDYTRRVPIRTRDEFGALALGFNQMTENIQASRAQLEATVDRLKTAQAQLVQSEKLSGIGEFVAGVAHELNNPLTTVMGFSELLQQDKLDPKHQEFVSLIHKNSQRCQRIVQSLLSFARRHQPERKPANLNELIESSLDILQYQLRTSNIELQLRLDPKLPLAMVDTHQVQQVLVNILNNARQAIEHHAPKGLIKIATEPVGNFVRITIQDSGPGIGDENLSKIFDPFFTTKDVGKGTGLGLSLCYGIIKEHGGTIVPSSRPGQGATFTIDLPITYELAPTATPTVASVPASRISNEGVGKRVLVIDDEEPILQMVREALTRHGYAVDIANSGEAGLARLRSTRYDLTLCDMKMPGLTGPQVYERLREIDPALASRLIFVTGDMVNEKTRAFLDAEKKLCLPKPFTLAEFRAAINQVVGN